MAKEAIVTAVALALSTPEELEEIHGFIEALDLLSSSAGADLPSTQAQTEERQMPWDGSPFGRFGEIGEAQVERLVRIAKKADRTQPHRWWESRLNDHLPSGDSTLRAQEGRTGVM
jgi:hypothetical protein